MCAELAPGQVWELLYGDGERPCLLLAFPHPERERNRVWEVLDLTTGRREWADEARWSGGPGFPRGLVGRRLL